MQVEIRFHGIRSSAALREHAERRVGAHLSRFGRSLTSATIRIGDVNGPKGGPDKVCLVTVYGPRIDTLALEERGEDPYVVVDAALDRAARAIGRALERSRTRARLRGRSRDGTRDAS